MAAVSQANLCPPWRKTAQNGTFKGSWVPHATPPPPEPAKLAANESASESAARFTRLGGWDQKFDTKYSLLCVVSFVVIIPFCMALPNQCCTQNFGFWQLRRISTTRWALADSGGGGGLHRGRSLIGATCPPPPPRVHMYSHCHQK